MNTLLKGNNNDDDDDDDDYNNNDDKGNTKGTELENMLDPETYIFKRTGKMYI
jgi:hypothetical protein